MNNIQEIKAVEPKKIYKFAYVTVKELGRLSEICYTNRNKTPIKIRKLDNEHYLNLETKEILKFCHTTSRFDNVNTIRTALTNLRDYINFNVTDVSKAKWITLTYSDNMTNTKKLYTDFEKFIKRFRYAFKDYQIEYIVAMEPQARGAWHAHLILIFDKSPRLY